MAKAKRTAEPEEIWIPIKGWYGKYEVSNKAQVRRGDTGQVLKPLLTGCPYYYYMFYNPELKTHTKRVKVYLHRAVALHWVPNPGMNNEVNHKDGDKLNCLPENLEWVSKKENSQHALTTGLHVPWFSRPGNTRSGSSNQHAKLNWEIVDNIRATYSNPATRISMKKLANKYGVARKTIDDIIKYRTYKLEKRHESDPNYKQ